MIDRVGKRSKPGVAGGGEPPDARVLICIPTLGGGGAERQVRLLAPRLVDRGIRLSLFSRLEQQDVMSLSAYGIDCFPIRSRGNHHPRLPLELMAAVLQSGAEVIHTFLTQMDIIGGAVALATRRKWILSERLSISGYGSGPKDRMRRLLGKHADLLIANSESGLEGWPTCRNRLVIPNGIVVHVIDAALAMPATGRPTLISVARLHAAKRIDRLLKALPWLRLQVPDILLVLLGKGPEEGKLKRLAQSLGVENNVIFAGHRTDPWQWVKGADIFISASSVEGHPNAVLEAAVAGTPLILSDIWTHREAVGDDGALFIDADDGEAMTKAVLSVLNDREAAQSRAISARKAVQDLCADKTADAYAGVYRELISGTRHAAFAAVASTRISGLGSSPG